MSWSSLPVVVAVVDLLCPPRCAVCRSDMPSAADGLMACGPCRDRITRDLPRCPACGLPASGMACRCGDRPRDVDGIAILGGYGDSIRECVLRAKRPGGEQVAAVLAALLVEKHRAGFDRWRIDTVAGVPMHWRRRLARGSSAAGLLAAGVAGRLRLPHRRLLRRRRATAMQNERAFEDRRRNVRAAFSASRRAAGRRVLLVDDVTTTGATLAECRLALVEAGASAVYAAVVARADRGGDAGRG